MGFTIGESIPSKRRPSRSVVLCRGRYMTAKSFTVTIIEQTEDCVTLGLAFGEPAQNDRIVRDAIEAMKALHLTGGKRIRFNGPASLPVAMALCHEVAHIFGAVAVFDPKLQKYVVCVSHDPLVPVGSLLD